MILHRDHRDLTIEDAAAVINELEARTRDLEALAASRLADAEAYRLLAQRALAALAEHRHAGRAA